MRDKKILLHNQRFELKGSSLFVFPSVILVSYLYASNLKCLCSSKLNVYSFLQFLLMETLVSHRGNARFSTRKLAFPSMETGVSQYGNWRFSTRKRMLLFQYENNSLIYRSPIINKFCVRSCISYTHMRAGCCSQ